MPDRRDALSRLENLNDAASFTSRNDDRPPLKDGTRRGTVSTNTLARHFGELLKRLGAVQSPELTAALSVVCEAASRGDVCVQVADNEQIASLRASGVVGWPGDFQPLILDGARRLYLHRLWAYEKTVGDAIAARLHTTGQRADAAILDRFFPKKSDDLQRRAAEMAVRECFAIITGGPGTGKTRIILAILTLLIAQSPRLALVAPTGKAAARMKESILRVATQVSLPEDIMAKIPTEARTIHRLLIGLEKDEKLPLDGVIVDEASMVDIGLLSRLARALPDTARLILIGDRNQLASVEAGAVLGDLCGAGASGGPLGSHIVELRKSHRFSENSGILALSTAVNAGDASAALHILEDGTFPDVRLEPTDSLEEKVLPHFQEVLASEDVTTALVKLDRFRVLCALRRGPSGVEGVNTAMEYLLGVDGEWFHGRPVLVTENDYALNLFNGETGITWEDPEFNGQLRVFFPGETAGTVRRFLPSSLPPHETAFAITVHRSQGSEFDEVLAILPPKDAPLLTRELLYTAVTRARSRVTLVAAPEVLRTAIERRVERVSGLRDRFWKADLL